MKDRIEKLKKISPEIGEILGKAYENLMIKKDTAKKGGVNDIKEFQREESSFLKVLSDYENSYGIDKFESISEVYEYLINNGYKIASRTLYDHKKKGYLTGTSGKYSLTEVEEYAFKYLNKDMTEMDNLDGLSLVDKKNLAEIELKNLRAKREQIAIDEASGRLISRDIVDREFASRIEVIKRLLQEQEESLPLLLSGKNEREIRDILSDRYKFILESYSRELFSVKEGINEV